MKVSSLILAIVFLLVSANVSAEEKSDCHSARRKGTASLNIWKRAKSRNIPRVNLRQTDCRSLAPPVNLKNRNSLPDTRLDSFVLNSGGLGEAIYGTDRNSEPPPYFGFVERSRIDHGIINRGLSTQHAEYRQMDIPPCFWTDWKEGCGWSFYSFGFSGSGDLNDKGVKYGGQGWFVPKTSDGSVDLNIVSP